METGVNWCGPIAMVPSLHQNNVYIKRKRRLWRSLKCIPLVGAETPLTCEGKLPHLIGNGIGPRTETCLNWGGPSAMVPCFHQQNIYIQRKLRVWREQKCILLVSGEIPLTCAGRQTTPPHERWYMAENGNLRELGWTYHHCTMLPPRQCLYQKEATGMTRLEMYCNSRCRNPTYLSGSENHPISWGAV